MSDIEQVEGGIVVRTVKDGFERIVTPVGFTDEAFRNAVAATYTAYMQLGKLPDVDDVYKLWSKIPKKTYSALFLTEEFKKALAYRGVDFDPDAGITMEQSMALIKMLDPNDRRSAAAKLKELNIPPARWQAWMKQPLFAAHYRQRGEDILAEAITPTLVGIASAAPSDLNAAKLLLEITGRWNPNAQAVQDARLVVTTIIEAVVELVGDAETRAAILDRVRGAMVSYDMTAHRQLEV